MFILLRSSKLPYGICFSDLRVCLNISFSFGQLMMNSLPSFSWESLYSTLFMKNIFAGYRIPDWYFLLLFLWNGFCYPPALIYYEVSVTLIFVSLYIHILFFMLLVFRNVVMICLDVYVSMLPIYSSFTFHNW